jgi:predicted ArsR family transcriptional regulator
VTARAASDVAGSESGRLRVLELLRRADGHLGISELATRSALHPNTVRFHVDRLLTDGLVTRAVEQRSRPGRPRLTFTAVPEHELKRDQRNYRVLADMLAGFIAGTSPDAPARSVALGESWGRQLARRPLPDEPVTEEQSVTDLLRVLDDIGFAPRLTEDDDQLQVLLRHCPFREVASAHREVVCSLHLGLMQGVLAAQHAPVEATQLEPFVEPSLCVAHLSRRA